MVEVLSPRVVLLFGNKKNIILAEKIVMILQKQEWIDLFNDYINPDAISYALEANAWFNTWYHYLYLAILFLIVLRLFISCISAVKKIFKS